MLYDNKEFKISNLERATEVKVVEPIVTPPVPTPVVEQKIVERSIPTCGAGTEDVNGICQVMSTEEKTSSLKIYQSRR